MELMLLIYVLGSFVIHSKASSEQVLLRDLNSDIDRRNLESSGLPSSLKFRLLRSNKEADVELDLQENKRLNANAPVFDVKPTPDGKQRLVRKESVSIQTTKFYQDKQNGGAFRVMCENQPNGACQRKLYGNFNISGRSYDLKPVPDAPGVPHLYGKRGKNLDDVPHVLIASVEEEERPHLNVGDSKIADYREIPDRHLQERKDLLEELRSLLNKKQKHVIAKKLRRFRRQRGSSRQSRFFTIKQKLRRFRRQRGSSRQSRSNNVYALEVLVAADPEVWNKYYEITSAGNGQTREEATEFRLRQHFAHIINGVSLRYESIEDPEMNIYVTLSGFIFYKTLDNTNPLPLSTNIPVVNGVKYADGDTYINSLTSWASSLENLPHNDHIAVFTGYELFSGSTSNAGVAGLAWLGGVCNSRRTSINEDGSYFVTVSVATHEIGHNLNSHHDGSSTSSGCTGNDSFIMAPFVASFYPGQTYTVNPWRFSQCSINAFKGYMDSLGSENCMLDHGDYYDKTEYDSHVTLLPGELHTPDEQCKLVRGEGSGLCSDVESEDICTTMLCKGENDNCWYYAAARGTPCGRSFENKWCVEGLCVNRSTTHTGGNNGGNSTNNGGNQVFTSTTTEAPDQSGGGSNGGCVDRGWKGWSCQRLSDHFLSDYGITQAQWCPDPDWNYSCCALCSGDEGQEEVVTTTTTTTTTEDPTTPSGGAGCMDIGWGCASDQWSCQRISDYFMSNYYSAPTDWCLDPNWKYRCCVFCAGYGI